VLLVPPFQASGRHGKSARHLLLIPAQILALIILDLFNYLGITLRSFPGRSLDVLV
jgi:hypothetical protein